MVATPGPILCRVRSTVLPGDDVFDVKRQVCFMILVDAAILATIAGPLSDEIAQGNAHEDLS